MKEIALSVSSDGLCSKWALNLYDEVLTRESSCTFWVSAGLADILFWEVITATLTVSDSVLTDTVFSIS